MNSLTTKIAFQDVTADTAYIDMNPLSCAPSSNIRSTSWAGVPRFGLLLNEADGGKLGPATGRMFCASNTKIVLSMAD